MAEVKKLNFDTGRVTYELNDTCKISFNPTDVNFAKEVIDVLQELDKKQDEREARVNDADNAKKTWDVMRDLDFEMRGKIDGLLGDGTCKALFGNLHVYAYNKEGLPVWLALLLTVLDEINTGVTDRTQGDISKKLEKYVSKYTKRK